MEGEDTSGQQTLQASCSQREKGSSSQCSLLWQHTLPSGGLGRSLGKGEVIIGKQGFKNALERSHVLLC